MWEWLAGSLPPSRLSLGGNQRDDAAQADKVARDLYADAEMAEAERVGAAYSLGRRAWHGDSVALHCLLSALAAVENPNARRAAVSGLGAAGDAAVPGLLEALAAADRPAAVAQAAEALGEACRTPTLGVVEGLATAMERLRSSHYPSTSRPEKPKASEDNGANRAVVMQAHAFCTSPAEYSYMCMSLSGRSFYSLILIYIQRDLCVGATDTGTDALKYVAQRLYAQVTAHGEGQGGDAATAITKAPEIAAALLAALSGHGGDDDAVVRECRGKALLSLAVLPRKVWGSDGALVSVRNTAAVSRPPVCCAVCSDSFKFCFQATPCDCAAQKTVSWRILSW